MSETREQMAARLEKMAEYEARLYPLTEAALRAGAAALRLVARLPQCPACGPTRIDEDGCCTGCGEDAVDPEAEYQRRRRT